MNAQARLERQKPWIEREQQLEDKKKAMQLQFEQSVERERQVGDATTMRAAPPIRAPPAPTVSRGATHEAADLFRVTFPDL